MALIKSIKTNELSPRFSEFTQAQRIFEDTSALPDHRLEALEYIIAHSEIGYTLRILNELFSYNKAEDHIYINAAFSGFSSKPKREEDFDKILKMLGSDNAYLRNSAIKFLQEYGKESKPFIEKLINSEDRDIRIFAINILGDVDYDESIDMLRNFISKESDMNALMTAVDYLGEIGNKDDVLLLESVKNRFGGEPYVSFGIDMAIDKLREE